MLIGKARIFVEVDIEVILIPLDDLVVGAIFVPTGNALLRQLGFFAATKPAVMNFLRDHTFAFLLIYAVSSAPKGSASIVNSFFGDSRIKWRLCAIILLEQ